MSTFPGILLLGAAFGQPAPAEPGHVAHPDVPCWVGERTWTVPGQPISRSAFFSTEGEEQPHRITHNRDQILSGGEIEQDYNFIDYEFRPGPGSIRARHYLYSDEVQVVLPHSADYTLNLARSVMPPGVLCYLQKRFRAIEVLTKEGYKRFWPVPK